MNRRKRILAKRILRLTVLLMTVFLAGCFSKDQPPDDGTPQPPAHNGVFSSEYGTMTFQGDGKTVTLELSEEFAGKSGLPAGKTECSYVFLFHNESYRYDKAEYFRIIIGEKNYQFNNEFGTTSESVISFRLPEGRDAVRFEKDSK